MKKSILSLLGFMVLLFVILTALNSRSDYAAGREFWHLNRQFSQIAQTPSSTPTMSFARLVEDLNAFSRRFADSDLAIMAQLLVGRTYVLEGEYEQAVNQFERIIGKYKDRPGVGVKAALEITRAHQVSGDKIKFVQSMKRLTKDFPQTPEGLKAPMNLAKFYLQEKDMRGLQESLRFATEHYTQMIADNPDSNIEFVALQLAADAYLLQKRWDKASASLGKVLIRYPRPGYLGLAQADNIIKMINQIALQQTQDYAVPIDIYQRFVKLNPQHGLNDVLLALVSNFQELDKKRP